jgi:NAD(P)-dependent dehydrogenase (short-subunit alcohol dehydrogenase family)
VSPGFVDLSGKVALVTGGSRGIGAGIVRSLLEEGAAVAFSYLSKAADAQAIVDEFGPERAIAIQADQADSGEVLRLWDEAVAWKGGIDVVVSNAVVRPFIPIDSSFEEWDKVWKWAANANLVAVAHLCRLAILHYRSRGGGIIVAISGRHAIRGDAPDTLPDGTTKGAVVSLIRGIARGFAKESISAFLVSPGLIRTPAAEEHLDHYGAEKWLAEIPIGELGEPRDIGNVVVFLASGRARYATGTTIAVHGASVLQ